MTGGQVSGDTGRVPVASGDHVTLVITSDVADEVHLHGYDLEAELSPGQPAEITFDATIPGVFEVELHEAGTLLLIPPGADDALSPTGSGRGPTSRSRSAWRSTAPGAAILLSFAVLLLFWRTPKIDAASSGRPLPAGLQRRWTAPPLRRGLQAVALALAAFVTSSPSPDRTRPPATSPRGCST